MTVAALQGVNPWLIVAASPYRFTNTPRGTIPIEPPTQDIP